MRIAFKAGINLHTLSNRQIGFSMKRDTSKSRGTSALPEGKVKAVLRGGTFHRVQVLLEPGLNQIEHCGLFYTVTRQKDGEGRVICTWSRV
jgi:hypothetical protein